MQSKSPMLRLWELGENEHGGLIRAIISAAAGVLLGMLPYFAAAQMIIALLGFQEETYEIQYHLSPVLVA